MQYAASAIILAGGGSRRMGCDKLAIRFGDSTLLGHVAASVSRVCREVIIAGGERADEYGVASSTVWVADPPGTSGPLAGLAAGLTVASNADSIVVAADMPFLSEAFLVRLLGLFDGCDAVVPLAAGRAQPLHAAYSRQCLPTARTLLRLGAHSMQDLLPRLRVRYLSEESCAELDPEGLSCFNMNTPGDLNLAREYWESRYSGVAAA
jgi:molybdopterin-guanine dinucleotide biosynthesis protein A